MYRDEHKENNDRKVKEGGIVGNENEKGTVTAIGQNEKQRQSKVK